VLVSSIPKKRHNRKIGSVAVGAGLYLKPCIRVMVSFLSPIVREKELISEKTNFSATQ